MNHTVYASKGAGSPFLPLSSNTVKAVLRACAFDPKDRYHNAQQLPNARIPISNGNGGGSGTKEKNMKQIVLACGGVAIILVVECFTIHMWSEVICVQPSVYCLRGKETGSGLGH